MDPISGALGIASVGLSLYGGIASSEAAQKVSQNQQNIIGYEEQQDKVRQEAMHVQAQRSQMEVLRNAQRMRSLALNNATGQGAQFGSGLQGGYGQVAGMAGNNMLAINQNVQSGDQMFALNAQINQQKIQMAQNQADQSQAQAIGNLGSTLQKLTPTLTPMINTGISKIQSGWA